MDSLAENVVAQSEIGGSGRIIGYTEVIEVAKMLADTVETVEEHYAQFVPAARDAVQVKMDSGVGIEEQAKIAAQRGNNVFARGQLSSALSLLVPPLGFIIR